MNGIQLSLDTAAESAAMLSIDDLPLPYLEIDGQGIVIRANRAALALHPPEQGELVGQFIFSFLAAGDREPSFQSFVAMMESRDEEPPFAVRYIYDRSGKFAAYQVHRGVIRDAGGKPTGMRVMAVNVSEATQALDEIQHRSVWLETILDSMNEAIVATDATGVIMDANFATEQLLGWTAAELRGKIFEDGIQMRSFHDGDRAPITFAMVLDNTCNGLATLVDRHGREVAVRIWASPILDKKNSSVAGVVLLMYKPGLPMIVPG